MYYTYEYVFVCIIVWHLESEEVFLWEKKKWHHSVFYNVCFHQDKQQQENKISVCFLCHQQ